MNLLDYLFASILLGSSNSVATAYLASVVVSATPPPTVAIAEIMEV